MNNNNDNFIFNFLNGFKTKTETKDEVTKLYIEGKINKEEYLKRMKTAI